MENRLTDSNDTILLANIGKRCMKLTRKPFKSTFKTNTIKGTMSHPVTGRLCYTFEEDESYVECFRCEIV